LSAVINGIFFRKSKNIISNTFLKTPLSITKNNAANYLGANSALEWLFTQMDNSLVRFQGAAI